MKTNGDLEMKRYKFKAMIESAGRGGACIFFPYDFEKEFGTKGRVPVNATFDGMPYRGSLVNYGKPQHMLPLLKAIREEIGKGPGDSVTVELWKDTAERTVEAPAPLEAAMKKAGLLPVFEALSYTHRREYCRWISEAKKDDTRQKRVEKAVEMLKAGVKTPDAPGAKERS